MSCRTFASCWTVLAVCFVSVSACTTPLGRPVRPLVRGQHEAGAAFDGTLGYGAFYRYGVSDRVMIGAGGGSGWPESNRPRGAALAEAHYALITPGQNVPVAEFLTLSFETTWQGFEDTSYPPGTTPSEAEIEGVRGSRLLFLPGVHLGLGDSVAVVRTGARLQIVRVLECEVAVQTADDLCRRNRFTRADRYVNGVFELGLELKLGPVVPYVLGALATDKSVSFGGGLGIRFGGR